jgi:hypothetical protein
MRCFGGRNPVTKNRDFSSRRDKKQSGGRGATKKWLLRRRLSDAI